MVTKAGGIGNGGSGLLWGEECPVYMGGRLVASSMVFTANLSASKPPIKLFPCFASTGSGGGLLSFGLPARAKASKDSMRS